MNKIALMNSTPVYIEISQSSLKVLRENAGLDLPLERAACGRLTDGCRQKISASLQTFLDRKPWQPRAPAFCAIGANGVSLRRLTLPTAAKEEFQRLLLLQIEHEFPLSPDELAWGWQPIETGNSMAARREVLVAAVKKEIVEDYANVLLACGVNPVFTVAALVRKSVCPPQLHPYATLEPGRSQSELVTFDPGVPVAIRVLSTPTDASLAEAVRKSLGPDWNGRKIFLTGASDELAAQLQGQLANGVACEALKIAGIVGLKKSVEQNGGSPSLVLQVKTKQANGSFNLSTPDVKKWAVRAAALLCALLLLPYAEALLLKPFLARKLATLKADKGRLAVIDRELEFLQSLKQTQPPYLDAMYILAKSTPQGGKIDSLTMNRRGDVSLRGSLRDAAQVTDFRTKLIGSGFFANVAVEEQAPTPDRQKLNLRISAQWKSVEARAGLTNGPTAEEIEKAKTGVKDTKSGGGMPPGMMPPGAMPAGMMPGMPAGGLPPGFKLPPGVALPADLPPEILKQLQSAQH